jgi:hypothetical protein
MLENIQVSDVQRLKQQPQVVVRRNKLIKALHDQLQAASAFVEGKQFFKTIQRNVKNKETGAYSVIETQRLVHPWFWEDPWGGVYMQVRYGSRIIMVKDGLPTIVVGEPEQLVEIIQLLKDATANGQFDEAIESVHRRVGRDIPKTKSKAGKGS